MLDGGLLRAILNAPDDDLPRLVAADWLDGHGDPERAEFIRVQCELAHTEWIPAPGVMGGIGGKTPADAARYDTLCRRERELLGATCPRDVPLTVGPVTNNTAWLRDLPMRDLSNDLRLHGYALTRGFLSQITCSWQQWQQHADAILAACPIRGAKDGCVRFSHSEDVVSNGFINATTARDSGCRVYIHPRWPGVRFELPGGGWEMRNVWATPPNAAAEQMVAVVDRERQHNRHREAEVVERVYRESAALGIRDASGWELLGTRDPQYGEELFLHCPECVRRDHTAVVRQDLALSGLNARTTVRLRLRGFVHDRREWESYVGQCGRCLRAFLTRPTPPERSPFPGADSG